MNTYLGIEFGSTRIKAVEIGEDFSTVASSDYVWAAAFEDGVWTYDLSKVEEGLATVLSGLKDKSNIRTVGISGMMHGYLAFDKDWNLLVPFRTWQNMMTSDAARELSELFGFNIPQRWSIAHFYQAILNGESHIPDVAHITTLAGYVHHLLTGENVLGIGEASGMFPIDSRALDYDEKMVEKFDLLIKGKGINKNIRDLLPKVLCAGDDAGALTENGARYAKGLPVGLPFAPPEGDAGTGMVATNAVLPGTGNVSAGTSIFSMVVLDKPLENYYEEIDIVTTPDGKDVAMVHCNNCTRDSNEWVSIFGEVAELFGVKVPASELYTKLYEKSLEGDADCGGVLVCNYVSGESITHIDDGRPLVVRSPESRFNLANFFRSQLYSTMATLKIGMEILERENVRIDRLTGHGGLFKTPIVGQRYMAAACGAPITCMKTAGEGGPYGMALLAAYRAMKKDGETLPAFLSERVFCAAEGTTLAPTDEDVKGYTEYIAAYRKMLEIEKKAVEMI